MHAYPLWIVKFSTCPLECENFQVEILTSLDCEYKPSFHFLDGQMLRGLKSDEAHDICTLKTAFNMDSNSFLEVLNSNIYSAKDQMKPRTNFLNNVPLLLY